MSLGNTMHVEERYVAVREGLNKCTIVGIVYRDKYCRIPSIINTLDVFRKPIEIKGNRITDLSYFLSKLSGASNHSSLFDCKLDNLKVIKEVHNGLESILTFQCNMCSYKTDICTVDPESPLDINTRAVNGIISIGCGYSHLQDMCNNLDMPCISLRKFNNTQQNIYNHLEKASLIEMQNAAREEIEIAKAENKLGPDGVPEIMVVCDGTWAKRSYRKKYSSKSGAAVIIGFKTQKVLYLGIKNKYCATCDKAKYENLSPPEHLCFKNYTGASTGMEAAILVEGFKRSEEMYGIRYSHFIGDGDSNVYKRILETFPYRKPVQKIECKNHLLRNFVFKLEELCCKTSLGPIAIRRKIKQNILKMRASITKAIKHRKTENTPLENKISNLREDILNIPSHTFGQHSKCQHLKYFCKKAVPDPDNSVPEMMKCGIYSRLMECFQNLAKFSNSLIYDVHSNVAEQFNGVICKYIGGKRVNYTSKGQYHGRCHIASVSYNTKNSSFYNLHKIKVGFSPKRDSNKKYESNRTRANYRLKKTRRRLTFEAKKQSDPNYGTACEKPDLSTEEFEVSKKIFIESLKKTPMELEEIEKRTREQYNSIEWLDTRKKILTASNFGTICKRRATTSCQCLVKSLVSPKNFISSPTEWGKSNEANAIRQLSDTLKIEIINCGLFISAQYPYLGATPDGLIGEKGLVEIKCPFSARNMVPDDGIREKKITIWKEEEGEFILDKNHKWFYQIQGQLFVTQRKYCIFCVWTTRGLKHETVIFDEEFWKKIFPKLTKFYFDCLLPELVDSRLARNMPVRDPEYIKEAIRKKNGAKSS